MIPINFMWRGCASKSSTVPMTKKDKEDARLALVTVYYINCSVISDPLERIAFRDETTDIKTRLFRWDTFNPIQIFGNGFCAREQGKTSMSSYYSIFEHVHYGGMPTAQKEDTTNTHGFIATSLCSRWIPDPPPEEGDILYRYEIYVPGGIIIAATLGDDKDKFPEQKEVVFVDRIAPRYIRCAQEFELVVKNGTRKWEPLNNILFCNDDFDPNIKENVGKAEVITSYQDPWGAPDTKPNLQEILVKGKQEEEKKEEDEQEQARARAS